MNFCISTAFSQETFKVVDQNNQPLKNAVIELVLLSNTEPNQADVDSMYIMDQIGKTFEPKVLIVPQSSLVNFPNSDDIRHHVYSFSKAKPFELKLYASKPKNPLRFDNAGIVVLGCNIHDSMVGYIYVANNESVYLSDENGEIIIPQGLENIEKAYVWHAQSIQGSEFRAEYKKEQLNQVGEAVTFIVPIEALEPLNSFENFDDYNE